MSTAQAQRLIVVMALVDVGIVLAAKAQGQLHGSAFTRVFAIGALTAGLSIVAEVAPQVAGPFALLVMVSMAVRYRGAFGGAIHRAQTQPAQGGTK